MSDGDRGVTEDRDGDETGTGTGDSPDHRRATSRRTFLTSTIAAGVGGIGIGAAAGAGITHAIDQELEEGFDRLDPLAEPGFDHLVVLMFENRSFDNVLGHAYSAAEKPSPDDFDGLAQGQYSNLDDDGTEIPAHVYSGSTDHVMSQPAPDPGEHFPHVNTQIFGTVDSPENARLFDHEVTSPFNAPPKGTEPTMSGFVKDFRINYRALGHGKEPSAAEMRVAMGGFSAEMLPVFTTLAKNFAVFDRWFCSVPTQTFPNRSFFNAGTSHGFVTNKNHGGYDKWLDAPKGPTIFNRLQEEGLSWRVYYDATQMVSFTGLLHAPVLQPFWKTNFRSMEQFYEDVATGNLPAYAFVEPRMIFNHNDMHPPYGHLREGEVDGETVANSAVSDVRAGEALLHSVYSAIRGSRTDGGSNAVNTALLVTFDEHGGTYDHVPPPSAVPPTKAAPAGEMDFTFDRLGPRVPAILVSAYTQKGEVVHDEFHHTSVIATLCARHGLAPLTRRDATSNNLFRALKRDSPRQPYTWPVTHPQYTPPNAESIPKPDAENQKHRPLSNPANGLLGLLLSRYAPSVTAPTTFGEAYEQLVTHGEGLFGVRD